MVEKDKLCTLITKYSKDNELNNWIDILDFLTDNSLFVLTTIKISKRKLLQIPKEDLLYILDNVVSVHGSLYFLVYSSARIINDSYKYCLEISLLDCFQLMKKQGKTREIIINYDLILDEKTIQYLKKKR